MLAALALAAGTISALLPAAVAPTPAAADTAATGSAGLFVPAAGRLLDTRNGTGGYATPMPAGTVRSVPAAGVAGIPASGVSALALTLTAVGSTTAGTVSVAPGDVATPTGTALVFNPGDSVSNTDLVALHADGSLQVLTNATVSLIIDVQGYFTAGSDAAPGGFVPLGQTRIVDTRIGLNTVQGTVPTGGSITVTAAGLAGVPADAAGVYANIAVLGQTSNGYLRTYAADAAVPTTGALGFDDSAQAESVAIPLSDAGAFTVLVGAGGPVDLLIDIQGYFTAGDSNAGFTPAAVHLLDTRAAPVRTLAGNGLLTLAVAGVAGIPAVGGSLTAVALTVRTVQAAAGPASGYLRLWPGDQPEPAISSINYTSQNTYRTDLAIVAPAADGTITIHNGGPNPVDVVLDVQGWFADPGPAMPLLDSADYPEGGWGPPGTGDMNVAISDDGAGTTAQSYEYALDGAQPATVPGTATQLDLPLPAALGLHTLAVTAVDRYGVASETNDYTFNIGSAPDAPAAPAVTAGAAAAELTWASGSENGAPTLGYGFSLTDQTTTAAPLALGSCAGCSHYIITGLDPTHTYTAQLWAISAAGKSPTASTNPFTPDGTTKLGCADTDETCAQQDSQQPAPTNLPYQNYDLAGDTTTTDAGTVQADTTSTSPAAPTFDPQCDQPTDQRSGNWVCPITETTNTINPGGGGTGGYCNYTGSCYVQTDQ
ncbi:MAG TPA: hypothetical protein VFU36_17570, partial [Jatrophihabitans sp.]|nr:hypothetical protein [Jatrophihabitans sp.]